MVYWREVFCQPPSRVSALIHTTVDIERQLFLAGQFSLVWFKCHWGRRSLKDEDQGHFWNFFRGIRRGEPASKRRLHHGLLVYPSANAATSEEPSRLADVWFVADRAGPMRWMLIGIGWRLPTTVLFFLAGNDRKPIIFFRMDIELKDKVNNFGHDKYKAYAAFPTATLLDAWLLPAC